MTTGTTTLLSLALPVEGELDGTWGDVVNYGITDYVDIAVAGTLTLNGDGAVTLANTVGTSSGTNITSTTAQYAIVKVTGTLTTTKVITAPSYSKTYVVDNAATGGAVTFKASGQTGVSVAVGEKCTVYFNGTDFVKVASSVADGVTSVSGTGTVNGITLTGTVTSTGSLTLGGTLSNVNLTSQVTGTLPIANGGTGTTSTTFVNLATNVTGTLPAANGGTGITSLGSGVATFLGTPSSANLAAAVTDETGSGSLVFATSPTLVTPILGTPQSGNFSSGTFTWPTFNQNTTGTAAGLSSILAIASGGTGTATPNLTAGSGVSITGTWPNQTISATGSGGTITSVTGTAPVVSSGGSTPAISMAAATASANGYMTSTYASKLDGIAAGATNVTNTNQLTNGAAFITLASLSGTSPVSYSSGVISMAAATASVNGYMTSTYAAKLDGIAAGATNVTNTNQLTNGAGFITGSGNTTGSAGSVATTNFSIVESGGKLLFKYGGTTIASMDSSGNLTTVANATAYGTP